MNVPVHTVMGAWLETRERLVARGLLSDAADALSLRCPGVTLMWIGGASDPAPALRDWGDPEAADHAGIYGRRGDVGAIARAGGPFAGRLAEFGGRLPQVFDEQARHIGPMAAPVADDGGLHGALHRSGNALLVDGGVLCFGTTARRLSLNLELFEKCAKAYVLAVAAGGRVRPLPWLVRHIANGRLAKDERRAARAFERGEMPVESRGY